MWSFIVGIQPVMFWAPVWYVYPVSSTAQR